MWRGVTLRRASSTSTRTAPSGARSTNRALKHGRRSRTETPPAASRPCWQPLPPPRLTTSLPVCGSRARGEARLCPPGYRSVAHAASAQGDGAVPRRAARGVSAAAGRWISASEWDRRRYGRRHRNWDRQAGPSDLDHHRLGGVPRELPIGRRRGGFRTRPRRYTEPHGVGAVSGRPRPLVGGISQPRRTADVDATGRRARHRDLIGPKTGPLNAPPRLRFATSALRVRRDKAALSSGCKSHPAKRSSRKQPEQSWR